MNRREVLDRIEKITQILQLRDGGWMPEAVRVTFAPYSDDDLLGMIAKDACSLLTGATS